MASSTHEIQTHFGRCRCCLNYGYLKNMWEEHYWEGKKEIYVHMLVQCFALSWEHTEESMEHDQICETCVTRLRDAHQFKKIVLESQEQLLGTFEEADTPKDKKDTAASTQIKIENEYEIQFKEPSEVDSQEEQMYIDDPDDPDYVDPDDPGYPDNPFDPKDSNDPDDMQYEEVEYLEDEDNKEALAAQEAAKTERRTKAPVVKDPSAKWPRKLPKCERYKTYKQYTEEELRKCLEAIKSGQMTPQEGSDVYKIPKKTITAKLKETKDNQNGNTTKDRHKTEQVKTEIRRKTAIFRDNAIKCRKKLTEENDINDRPVNAEDVRTKYKAIVREEFNYTNKEPEKSDVNEFDKHKNNIKHILESSNATLIKGFWRSGYSCCFCNIQKEQPSELKAHNLETHSHETDNVIDNAIKVKYVTDLVIRLDITDLRCKLCQRNIDSLESLMDHLVETHDKNLHTDIENRIIPFKFGTEGLHCVKCKKKFKYFKLLSEHMSEHYKNYECPKCDRTFITKQSMQKHLSRHRTGEFKTEIRRKAAILRDNFIKCRKILTEENDLNDRPVNAEDVRTIYKAIEEFNYTNKEPEKSEVNEFDKYKNNIKHILESSNATLFKGFWRSGYSCCFCNIQKEQPSELKAHNLETHSHETNNVIDNAIKVKYVTDLVIRLDITDLRCKLCQRNIDSLESLMDHLVKTHDKNLHTDIKNRIIPFKFDTEGLHCVKCKKEFKYFKLLSEHMSEHYNNYECLKCDRTFITKQSVQKHLSRHRTGEFKTEIRRKAAIFRDNVMKCRKKLTEEDDINDRPVNAEDLRTKYKAIVREEFNYTNKEPEKSDINEFDKHKNNIKHILESSNATLIKGFWRSGYSCCFCNIKKEQPSELKAHNLETHSHEIDNIIDNVITVKYVTDLIIRLDITDLRCKLCQRNIDSLESLMDHLVKTHDKKLHTDIKNRIIPFKFDTEGFHCVKCKKKFKYFKVLSEHMSEHYKNYECPICDRTFITKQSMQKHLYRHETGVFKCWHCPKVFDTRPKRSVHIRVIHTLSNKAHKCKYCGERFRTRALVRRHEAKIHGAEIPRSLEVFNCQACNKSYNSESCLIIHQKRYHLIIRPHKCSFCDMAFYSKQELTAHTVTHTKTRDFKCNMCSKLFGTKCCLRQHMRIHLNDRRFKCDSCERTFAHRTAYRGHMRSIHGKIV